MGVEFRDIYFSDLMMDLMKECVLRNVPFTIRTSATLKPIMEFSGFYKSGTVRVYELDDELFCKARYDEVTQIYGLDDLVRINFIWFDRGTSKGWKEPDEIWEPLLLEAGWLEKTVKEVVTYNAN